MRPVPSLPRNPQLACQTHVLHLRRKTLRSSCPSNSCCRAIANLSISSFVPILSESCRKIGCHPTGGCAVSLPIPEMLRWSQSADYSTVWSYCNFVPIASPSILGWVLSALVLLDCQEQSVAWGIDRQSCPAASRPCDRTGLCSFV